MKLLRRVSSNFLLDISELFAGNNTLSFCVGCILALAAVITGFMLINRVGEYDRDNSEESFKNAKSVRTMVQWVNSIAGIWLFLSFVNIFCTFQFGRTRAFFFFIGILGYSFSWYALKKFSAANKNRNIELMKTNRGDPSIVMSDSFGLSQSERDAVSAIVGSAGIPSSVKNPLSDEELYGPIDDPVFDDPHTVRKVCKSCGKINKAEYTICAYCGMPLGKGMSSEEMDKVNKILNRDNKDEDPVTRILKGAGVMAADGSIIKKKAKDPDTSSDSSEGGIKVTPTTEKTDEGDISVTALEGNYNIENGSGIYHRINQAENAVTATEGNYISERSPTEYEREAAADSLTAENTNPNTIAASRRKIERIKCPHCDEKNNKNNTICAYCGKQIK